MMINFLYAVYRLSMGEFVETSQFPVLLVTCVLRQRRKSRFPFLFSKTDEGLLPTTSLMISGCFSHGKDAGEGA